MPSEREPLINYSLYSASDGDEMAGLLGEVFAERDPPAVAIGLTAAEFESFVHLFCSKAADEGLTIIARSAETGEMCGALLTEDSASAMPDGLGDLDSKFNPVFDLLGQMDEEYRSAHPVEEGKSVHLFLLGVRSKFAGQGVGHRLVSECLSNAARRGYRVAVTEATNKTSQHIFRNLGFSERVKRSYFDHRYEGKAYFASIADQGGPILMDKGLDDGQHL